MTTTWHPDDDATPTPRDVTFMAEVLEGRHGTFAAEVAEFFATYHGERGDAGRAWGGAGLPSWSATGNGQDSINPRASSDRTGKLLAIHRSGKDALES